MHTVWQTWRFERGSNVAQATAVAMVAAAMIGALVFFAPALGRAVDTRFACLVGTLGGAAGADCAAGEAPPASADDLGDEGCDLQCQLIGVLKGFIGGGWDALWGLVSLG